MMPWRRHVAVISVILLVLLVNKFLVASWHDNKDETKVPYQPSHKLGAQEKTHQGSQSATPSVNNKVVDTLRSNSELIKDTMKVPLEKHEKDISNKGALSKSFGDYMMYLNDYEASDITDKFINKHEYVFTLNNKYACEKDVFVVIVIHSAPGKTDERQMIRNTWGSITYYSGATIAPIFLLGQVAEDDGSIQENIEKESKKYRDIVQGNFIDSYKNLTAKNIMGLHWVQNYCENAKFVLKTDDDTMINIYHMVNFLFIKSPDGDVANFLYCSTFINQGPRRDKSDKWYVPFEEYKYSKYPPYCEGFAYIMSYDVSKKLYEASRDVKPYWVDDVYVTGFLALKAGIYHKNMEQGHGYHLMESSHIAKTVQSSMFILAKYASLRQNWDRTWSDIKIVNRILD